MPFIELIQKMLNLGLKIKSNEMTMRKRVLGPWKALNLLDYPIIHNCTTTKREKQGNFDMLSLLYN